MRGGWWWMKIMKSHHILTKALVCKMCEKIITPPFHFDHLPTQVPKSPYWLQGLESAIIFAYFILGLAPTEPFVSKKPKKLKFHVRFET